MDLLSRFREFTAEKQLPLKGNHLLLAVSGGMDSVVLCHLCRELGFSFSVAHCNFSLRGEESEEDEKFVRDLAAQWGVECLVKRFDTAAFAAKEKMGIQEAARQLRYDWFDQFLLERVDEKNRYDFLLTAHHADDNVETLLMNFFKGTGIKGLGAIPVRKGRLIRPLLFAFREDIQNYATHAKLAWREDSSNLSAKYTRNYFRLEVIPAIEKVFPQVRANLNDNIGRFGDIGELYDYAAGLLIKKLLVKKGEEVHIPALKLAGLPGAHTLIFEISRPFGFTPSQSDDIFGLITAGTGKYVDSLTHRILKNRNWLIITPLKNTDSRHIIIDRPEVKIEIDGGAFRFSIEDTPAKISADSRAAMLDASRVSFPLLLRKWKQGDYFYPLGMRKKKKLSRFFIDQKIPLHEKENILVLESAGRIIWVVGHRIDDRFKIVPSTSKVLHISYQ